MDNQTISIVIPVFKAEATISRCVDSLLRQTWPNWELILVDDGSPDRSGEICDRLAAGDSRIRVFHTPNHGAGSARNFGLDHCNTKWVTFIDADDDIEPGYLENFHLTDHDEQANIIIMQGYRRVTEHKEPLDEYISLKSAEYKGNAFFERAILSDHIFEYGQTVGKVYQLNIINKYGIRFPSEFHLSEDHVFYLTYLLYVECIHTYSGTLYNYISNNDIMSLSLQIQKYDELYIRYQTLYNVCARLKECHGLSSYYVEAKIDYFAVTASLSLLLCSLYKQERCRRKRVECLKNIFKGPTTIREKFKPHNIKGKVVRLILSICPLSIADKLLKVAYSRI